MLTNAGAIGLSLVAIRLAAKPARGALTFGLKRTEILSAQFNGATLLVLALVIIYEGITRLVNPPEVGGTVVLVVALVGIVVNLAASYTLSKANRQLMNVEGAFQHILTDLAAFIFTAIAGAVILTTGFRRADGIASLVIAAIMLYAAYGLLKASGRVFLEAAPQGLNPDAIGNAMASQTGVSQVHDLHVWEITSGFPSLSAHVLVDNQCNCHAARRALEQCSTIASTSSTPRCRSTTKAVNYSTSSCPSSATSQSSQHAGPLDQQRATGERRTAIPIEGELVSTSQRGAGVRQVPWFRGITRTGLMSNHQCSVHDA